MLTLTAKPAYRSGKRYLYTVWGEAPNTVYVRFYWNDKIVGPSIQFRWWWSLDPYYGVDFTRDKARNVLIYWTPTQITAALAALGEKGHVERRGFDVTPPARLSDVLSVARSVAAGKAPTTALAGFIEDNWDSPWSLLASESPADMIRELCPIPLLRIGDGK